MDIIIHNRILADTRTAFHLKSDKNLRKSVLLFKLMNNHRLVNLFSKLLPFAMKTGLPVKQVLKATIFAQFCGGENLKESGKVVEKLSAANVKTILDYSVEGGETEEGFDNTLNELLKILLYASQTLSVPYTSVKLSGLCKPALLEKYGRKLAFTTEEETQWKLFNERLNLLFTEAKNKNIPVYIDAEESWLQTAIDQLAEKYMLHFNHEQAVVLTTLQMYRHDRMDYLNYLLHFAIKAKIKLGIKLVRGAYIEKENRRAEEAGIKSPIHACKEATDKDFNRAIEVCLDHINLIFLCAGTHNEESTLFLVEEMNKRKLPPDHPHIYFSQLYGMSDHISMNLAAQGYNVTKYLPYGPVESVIPYLIRRAEENSGISGQMSRELHLLLQEKTRREKQRLLKA